MGVQKNLQPEFLKTVSDFVAKKRAAAEAASSREQGEPGGASPVVKEVVREVVRSGDGDIASIRNENALLRERLAKVEAATAKSGAEEEQLSEAQIAVRRALAEERDAEKKRELENKITAVQKFVNASTTSFAKKYSEVINEGVFVPTEEQMDIYIATCSALGDAKSPSFEDFLSGISPEFSHLRRELFGNADEDEGGSMESKRRDFEVPGSGTRTRTRTKETSYSDIRKGLKDAKMPITPRNVVSAVLKAAASEEK